MPEGPITIVVRGAPVPKGRPRYSSAGSFVRVYTPAKTTKYENTVRTAVQRAMGDHPPMTGPMTLRIEFRLSAPASWPKKKRLRCYAGDILPTKKPDLDNFVKSILDGANGVLFDDDARITDLIISKRYADPPEVVIVAAEIAGKEAA